MSKQTWTCPRCGNKITTHIQPSYPPTCQGGYPKRTHTPINMKANQS